MSERNRDYAKGGKRNMENSRYNAKQAAEKFNKMGDKDAARKATKVAEDADEVVKDVEKRLGKEGM